MTEAEHDSELSEKLRRWRTAPLADGLADRVLERLESNDPLPDRRGFVLPEVDVALDQIPEVEHETTELAELLPTPGPSSGSRWTTALVAVVSAAAVLLLVRFMFFAGPPPEPVSGEPTVTQADMTAVAPETQADTTAVASERDKIIAALTSRYHDMVFGPAEAAPLDPRKQFQGSFDVEYVERAIEVRLQPAAHRCYEQTYGGTDAGPDSLLFVATVIGDESVGSLVDHVTTHVADPSNELMLRCVNAILQDTLWEPPRGGAQQQVVFPVLFSPAGWFGGDGVPMESCFTEAVHVRVRLRHRGSTKSLELSVGGYSVTTGGDDEGYQDMIWPGPRSAEGATLRLPGADGVSHSENCGVFWILHEGPVEVDRTKKVVRTKIDLRDAGGGIATLEVQTAQFEQLEWVLDDQKNWPPVSG